MEARTLGSSAKLVVLVPQIGSSNLNNSALGNSVVGSSVCHKQSTLPMKKVALRDVQNDNRSFMPNYPENFFLGRPVADPIKVLGAKILNPELPRSPPVHQFTSISSASDQLMHGGDARKLDSEQNTYSLNFKRYCSQTQQDLPRDGTKKQEHETSEFAPMSLASPVKLSHGKPPVPIFLGKPSNGLPAAHSRHLRFTPESMVSHLVGSEKNHDEQRTEGFLHLQNLLKNFDESDQGEYIQTLRYLSPSELSRYAIELEKRSMQLSVEEAKEIQRMMALNILGKSSMTSNSS